MKHTALFLLLMLSLAFGAVAADTNDFFAQGLALSRAGEFPAAAAAFEKSAHNRLAAGTLVDAGIAEWERGRAGVAILAWEQARWINPFDARAAGNLKFARAVTEVDAPELQWYETASTWLPGNTWPWLAGLSLWLALGLLVFPGIFRWRKSGWHQALAAVAFGVLLFSLVANYGVVARTDIGFVLKKNAPLLLTPTAESDQVSTLTAGEPARKLRARGNYYLIRTAFGMGWIEKGEFGMVNADGP